ncbi:MAG: nitrilase-related carbon-nitrogen hydrolase, partial [Acidimicrobiia bacterium]
MTRIAVIQMAAQDGNDLEESKNAVTEALDRAGPSDLYLLPEIWSPGYFSFDSYAAAAERFQETSEFLSGLAQAHNAYLHGGSIVERRGDRLHNTSLLFSPQGDLVASYRKIHLFGYQSREQQILTPGDEVVVADTELGRIGMAVCYDLRFPEQFRRMTDMGARLFLIASAWPHPRVEAWTTLLRARAIESQAYLAAANGAPGAGGASLCGRSAIIDPWGVTLA